MTRSKKSKHLRRAHNKRFERLLDKVLMTFEEIIPLMDQQLQDNAQEKINTSPIFADINHLCTQIIPLYWDFSLHAIYYAGTEEKLDYYYLSNTQWSEVKSFYRDYFEKNGWQFIGEHINEIGEDAFEVKAENYKITLLFDKDSPESYHLCCEKI